MKRAVKITAQATSVREVIMKDLVLDSILTVGIEEIDDDHSKLINLFNILNHSTTEGAATDYVGAVLEELINCTVWHFSHEERLMIKYGYEGYEEHRTDHQDLISGIKELQQKFGAFTGAPDEYSIADGTEINNEHPILESIQSQHILLM